MFDLTDPANLSTLKKNPVNIKERSEYSVELKFNVRPFPFVRSRACGRQGRLNGADERGGRTGHGGRHLWIALHSGRQAFWHQWCVSSSPFASQSPLNSFLPSRQDGLDARSSRGSRRLCIGVTDGDENLQGSYGPSATPIIKRFVSEEAPSVRACSSSSPEARPPKLTDCSQGMLARSGTYNVRSRLTYVFRLHVCVASSHRAFLPPATTTRTSTVHSSFLPCHP